MKEYDRVKLISEKDKYTKYGAYKGMVGSIMMSSSPVKGKWFVVFDGKQTEQNGKICFNDVELFVDEKDLELLFSPK